MPQDYDSPAWRQSGGITAFAPCAEDTAHLGDPQKQWMINFRVGNLDALVAQLAGAGIPVDVERSFRQGQRPGRQSDRAVGAGRTGP